MKDTLWEEENSIDRNQNLTKREENVNLNTTTETVTDSTRNGQKDTTINSGIYKIVNKINGKYYVGSSNFFENRWTKHRKLLRRNVHENPHLQSAWNKYGKDAFEFFKIEFVKVEVLLEIEQKYLDIAKTEQDKCYNMNFVASIPPSWKGRKRSPETIQRMRDCKMGDKNPMFGKKHSEEHKKKLSNSLKGNPNCAWTKGKHLSDEHKKSLSKSLKGHVGHMKGKHHSDKTKLKLSLIHTGRLHDYQTDKTIYTFVNTKTDEKFVGIRKDFVRNFPYVSGSMSRLMKRKNLPKLGWVVTSTVSEPSPSM